MKHFISAVRIFYTVTLILLMLGGFVLYTTEKIAAQHGSTGTSQLESHTIFIILFSLLLASRLLYYRSQKWLWLGLPTILAVYGFIAFSLLYPLFLGY